MRFIVATIFLLMCSNASAQIYQVRSGEHEDFSRIVILFPETPEWEFGRVEGGYELRTSEIYATYDLSTVFELIPRNRILSIEIRSDARIFFNVACVCHSDVFEIREGLVIDIKDGISDPRNIYDNFLDEITDGNLPFDSDQKKQNLQELEENNYSIFLSENLFQYHPRREKGPLWTSRLAVTDQDKEDNSKINEISNINNDLISQIGSAAKSGLIKPRNSVYTNHLKNIKIIPSDLEYPDVQNIVGDNIKYDTESPNPQSNINIETIIERNQPKSEIMPTTLLETIDCKNSAHFDVASWGGGSSSLTGSNFLRSSIFDELGNVDQNAVENLAKSYIYHSFGIEAHVLIKNFLNNKDMATILLKLSDLVEGNEILEDINFKNQVYCQSKGALWSAIAFPFDERYYNKVAKNDIILDFSELPPNLRVHLGYRLAANFMAVNDIESAQKIKNSISRSVGQENEAYFLIDNAISRKSGNTVSELDQLRNLAESDSELAYDAMLNLMEALISQRNVIDQDLLDILDRMVAGAYNDEIGKQLRNIQLEALFVSGNISIAMNKLDKLYEINQLTLREREDIFEKFLSFSLSSQNESDFLNFILNYGFSKIVQNKKLRILASKKLLDAGFTEAARDAINHRDYMNDPEAKILIATSYLLEGQGELAIRQLTGLSGPEADILRAEAYEQLGDFSSAAISIISSDDTEGQRRLALRSRDWETLSKIGSESEIAAASIFLNNDAKLLSGSEDNIDSGFITRSQLSREAISALLGGLNLQ